MTPLEEARAFQAEATKGSNRQKGRPSARARGGRGRDRGDSPHTPSARGGRGGGGRGGSLLQRATSRAAHQPAPFEQDQSGRHLDLPSTPSYTPQDVKPRPFAIPIVAPPSTNSEFTPSASPSSIRNSRFAPQAASKATASGSSSHRQLTFQTRGRGMGRGPRIGRYATREEEDAVKAFFTDPTPAPVGEVRYYQEEYEKQRTEVPSAATSRSQGEPIAPGDNTSHEANPNTEPATSTQKEDAKPKEEAEAEMIDSKTADDQEHERAALLREIEEQEAALAEMKKLIAIKRADAEKLKKDKAEKLHVNSAGGDVPGVLRQITNAGSSLKGPNQDNAATGFIASPEANLGGAQSSVPALTESSQIMVSQSGFNSQASVSHNTGDTMPNPASKSMDDLMDLDFKPATIQYVPHPTPISPLDFSNGHSSFQNSFQEAEEEEEL